MRRLRYCFFKDSLSHRKLAMDSPRSVRISSWGMYGTGGNKVVVFPSQEIVVVITTTNFRVPSAAALSEKLITDYILNAGGLAVK
jgi:hypothetical protein